MALLILSCLIWTFLSASHGFAIKAKRDTVCDFDETAGYALYTLNEKILYQTSLDECKAVCIADGNSCLSFDYKANTDSCFMSSQSKETNPDAFGKHHRASYYHKVCREVVPTTTTTTTTAATTTTLPPDEENSGDDFSSGSGSGSGDGIELNSCVESYGPFGGSGGSDFSDESMMALHGDIDGIIVTVGSLVHCIGMIRGNERTCYGGIGQHEFVEMLQPGEYITGVMGREGGVIDQIGFMTNKGRELGPYGGTGGSGFNVETNGKKLAYISGKTGELVDKVTFHFYC